MVHHAPLDDTAEDDLIGLLGSCCEFITQTRDAGQKVLVHCNGGVSRSPSVVVAYLMKDRNITFDTALSFVQASRPWIRVDRFVPQLRSWGTTCNSSG